MPEDEQVHSARGFCGEAELLVSCLQQAGAALDAARSAHEAVEIATRSAEVQRHSAELVRIEQEWTDSTSSAREDQEATLKSAEAKYLRNTQKIEKSGSAALSRVEEAAASDEETIGKTFDEVVWMAETVFEAGEEAPRIDFERERDELKARLKDIHSCLCEADAYLRTCRMHLPAVPHSESTPLRDVRPAAVIAMQLTVVRTHVAVLKQLRGIRLFRGPILLPPLLIAVALGAGIGLIADPGSAASAGYGAAAGLGFCAVTIAALYRRARLAMAHAIQPALDAAAIATSSIDAAIEAAQLLRTQREVEREATRTQEIDSANRKFPPLLVKLEEHRKGSVARLQEKIQTALTKEVDARCQSIKDAELTFAVRTSLARRNREEAAERESARGKVELVALSAAESARVKDYSDSWISVRNNAQTRVDSLAADDRRLFPDWSNGLFGSALPASGLSPGNARFGSVTFAVAKVSGCTPSEPDLAWPTGAPVALIPMALTLPAHGSLLVECGHDGREAGLALLQSTMMRLLVGLPPGKVRFTIVDPVGLGQGFAAFMHLADEMEQLVGERIWTEPRMIEQKLSDLCSHMENVIQKYLRNEFASIDEYNARAGEIAEPYRFLVLCDFPANISEQSAKRLASIVNSGARCGVWTLILRDDRLEMPPGIDLTEVRDRALRVQWRDGAFVLSHGPLADLPFTADSPPDSAAMIGMLKRIGAAARLAGRVEVPFQTIAPPEGKFWTESSSQVIRVPLGRAGAVKLQFMTLGEGTCQHALIAGKTGSGKSTLLHALITNLSLWYSPDEVEFYLVDFKKGVEFKTYATHALPHARAVAVESDREFGLSVLQGLDNELKRRGEIYRDLGVQDLAGYRRSKSEEVMPRILLIIDEFQELFTEDDRIGQDSSLLLDRLVRQGRAFGMHVVLGSQTLGGAYSLARTTMGQMGIRIALQCNEADSQLILSDENVAARLLSRPGEAIYNDAGGLVEGNSPFQVVWLPEATREQWLEKAAAHARSHPPRRKPGCIVFEGNAPADLRLNKPLSEARPQSKVALARLWLGDAISIKDPTAAMMRRQSGANVVVVGQRDEAALALSATALVSIAAQHEVGRARVVLLDSTPPDDPGFGNLAATAAALGLECETPSTRELADAMTRLGEEVGRRAAAGDTESPSIYLLVHGSHRLRPLKRNEDDFSFSASTGPPAPDKLLAAIVRDGPALGVHTFIWVDTAANLARNLDRGSLKEFDQRVLFQVSATDSSTLIDSPLAARLGFHRALLHNEEHGTQEKFRPYAYPPAEMIAAVSSRRRLSSGTSLPPPQSNAPTSAH